ncbi:MAG: hypothetical protein IPP40_12885 [bacterium]|nr:hypothetical protein [bacterium]
MQLSFGYRHFTLNVGEITTHDPTGPDAYGYYAFDNSDSSYQRIESSYLDISDGIGEDLNIDDPGEDFCGKSVCENSCTPVHVPILWSGL